MTTNVLTTYFGLSILFKTELKALVIYHYRLKNIGNCLVVNRIGTGALELEKKLGVDFPFTREAVLVKSHNFPCM